MSERKLFGTDGIRGLANSYPLDPQTVVKVGQSAGAILCGKKKRPLVVIGRDSRISGQIIEAALIAGLGSVGVDVKLLGVLPTPAVAMFTKSLGADAGVVITASHNPACDNGIKFFSSLGVKLPDGLELAIEEMIFADNFDNASKTPPVAGTIHCCLEEAKEYANYVIEAVGRPDLSGMKIVLDCANGAASIPAPEIFSQLGAAVTVICDKPDGLNINKDCGAMHPEKLAAEVVKTGADIGLAFDGDADRLIVVDHSGQIVDGDTIMYIIALDHKAKGNLQKDTIVVTDYSNLALDATLKTKGVKTVRVENGDRYVIQEMLKSGYCVGGEKSGHIVLGNYNTTGDGIMSALYLANAVRKSGISLANWASQLVFFPQVLDSVEIKEKTPLEKIPGYPELKEQIETALGSEGRLFVRYSGTQNVCRVMLEGRNLEQITAFKDKVVAVIKR